MSHLVCITIKYHTSRGPLSDFLSYLHISFTLLQAKRFQLKIQTIQSLYLATCLLLGKRETEEGKYCLMSHSKTDNHFPLCCQTSIQVPCFNFQQSVMPPLLETASLAAVFNTASTPVNGDIIAHIKGIYPHQKGTIHRPH